jgi:hypothetical protein
MSLTATITTEEFMEPQYNEIVNAGTQRYARINSIKDREDFRAFRSWLYDELELAQAANEGARHTVIQDSISAANEIAAERYEEGK